MRPAAQERWLVCYDLEHFATNVLGYSELILDPEHREKVPELAEKLSENAKLVLELVKRLRWGNILEAERPPEILQGGSGWPELSPPLGTVSSAQSPPDLKAAQEESPNR
jgi:hypothetical protein